MILFGQPIETIYFYTMLITGLLTLLYILFGDIFDSIGEAIINPILMLTFLIFFSASGFVLEKISPISSPLIIGASAIISFVLSALLNIFVLIPMSNAEESLSYTTESLIGRVGKIIIPIPEDGFGEIFIESKSGRISKPAASMENHAIKEGQHVLVLEVKDGVLLVVPYDQRIEAEDYV